MTTVAGHLRQEGVPLRRQGMPTERIVEAIRLYSEGWSCQRLAERYDCDDETFRQTLKRAGSRYGDRGNGRDLAHVYASMACGPLR